jgi:prepilin-type N-terminal cleavage/methylation domain-containing protein
LSDSKQDFTLLELMVVVFIISVLAATSIPLFGRYLKRSKAFEAPLNLRKMYDGEVAYFYEDHTLASGALASRTFVETACEPPGKPSEDKRFGNFEYGNWPSIHFSIDSPIYYSYLVETANGNTFVRPNWVPGYVETPPPNAVDAFLARAFGNLDGDSDVSEFARFAIINNTDGEIRGMPGIAIFDEIE